MAGRRASKWANAWEIEKLSQLRSDLAHSLDRYFSECVRQATLTTNEAADEWMRKANQTEQYRAWALQDVDRWITELSKNADNR